MSTTNGETGGIDLHKMKRATSTTPNSERKRCPECEGMSIVAMKNGVRNQPEHAYKCSNCGERFDTPVYRE